MHSTVSDGTDTPEELLQKVRAAGIGLFALTDHDAVKGYGRIVRLLRRDDPELLSGVELSSRDEEGKYHILGYGFDPDSPSMRRLMDLGHEYRMHKTRVGIECLETVCHFSFPQEEIRRLLSQDNPGKPHIGNLMVKYGYAQTLEQAIHQINQFHIPEEYVRPEEAIQAILMGGGVPVLAHPSFGSGEERIVGDEMDRRLRRLMEFGLQGVEAFYSGFSARLWMEMLAFAEKYGLYVTAGSDYHGLNKPVLLGDTKLDQAQEMPDGLKRFMETMGRKLPGAG